MAATAAALLPFVLTSIVSASHTNDVLFPRAHHPSKHDHNHSNTVREIDARALPGNWTQVGCYSDSVAHRSISAAAYADTSAMTNEACVAFCDARGYALAGTEYSVECYCGNWLASTATALPLSSCNMACSGNPAEFCGGDGALLLHFSGVDPGPPPPPPSVLPEYGLWESLGCYTDNGAARTLLTPMGVAGGPVTPQRCMDACYSAATPFRYSGVEYAGECYCGHVISNGGAPATDGCDMACAGNSTLLCGGPNRLNLYNYTGSLPEPPPPPVVLPSYGFWESLGCWTDAAATRTLPIPLGAPGTVQGCLDACYNAGYPLGGVEYGGECWCGLQIAATGAPATDGCTMPCSGNSTTLCGGPNRLNMYNYTSTLPHGPNDPGDPNPGTAPPPLTTGLPSPWHYAQCWVDNAFGRILINNALPPSTSMTVETCIDYCDSHGFVLAGLQYSQECWCGNTVINAGTIATSETQCNMACAGDSEHACGGANRFTMYSKVDNITVIPVPITKTTNLPGSFQYAGCYGEPGALRVFPYFIYDPVNTTVENCLARCSEYGYAAAGLEYSSECWCGDFDMIDQNGGFQAPEADCSMPCVGAPEYHCGGVQRLSLYTWTSPPLYEWHTPAITGRYEFLIGGIVIPLIATLGLNDKVSFVEKYGTGPPNSTGAYELDPSLAYDFNRAWRTMHVESDVFCAGNLVLPDKSGRQISVGGWSYESTEGVRFYIPDGSPGVNGTNDWEENWSEIHLQQGRWYPTAMIMANGSILIVGGEEGSNGAPVPSLEILPKPAGGPTWLHMDWLQRTDPNNLYPFLWVLPGGGIFVMYYNEARILDEVTFETTKEFPIAPGNVVGGGGRTYPLEGTAVMLPQHAPYTDPVEIMACGGSNFGIALDNCVSIQPEGAEEWVIERMPSKRVLTMMVALPDGTFFITGGAHQGVAGFGLANDPNYNALIYDPSQPRHHRFSILNNTSVARMYHSEAILLADGRVLISGSDPQDLTHPQEYRIEVYYPPYLVDGRTQPEITALPVTDWAYGGSYSITVNLHQTGPIRFSLLGAVSSTHGNSMGQRTIFPEFSCSGNTCTIVAPPNAHICPPGWFQLFVLDGPTPSYSKWVRIGGDPAQLGLWPDFPDFTKPGI